MTIASSLLSALLLHPVAAHANNPCDADPKYCVDNLAAAAAKAAANAKKSGAALKAEQDYQVRVDALIARTTQLRKTVDEYNKKAQDDELLVDVEISKTVKRLGDKLSDQDRAALRTRYSHLLQIRWNLETYDRALMISAGTLEMVSDLLPYARLKSDQLWRVAGDLQGTESTVEVATTGIDKSEADLKTLAAQL